MAQSPDAMAATMMANIPEKTGKPLDQWMVILKTSGLEKHGQMVKLLKSDFGVTHGFANLIVHHMLNSATATDDAESDLVDNQYAGAKSDLKPIYDAIITAVSKFGSDVEIAPKKSYVSLRRNKQFALVQPSTKTRVDVGINLKDGSGGERLELSGSFNSMVTHRVRVGNIAEVDKQLIQWLKAAYKEAG
jgi:hypothetical protein